MVHEKVKLHQCISIKHIATTTEAKAILYIVKPVLNGHSKIDKALILLTNVF